MKKLYLILAAMVILICAAGVAYAVLQVPVLLSPANNSTVSTATPTFTWGTVPGATKYVLQLAKDGDYFSNYLIKKTVYATSYTSTTVLPNGTYKWRVRAVDQVSSGNWSLYRVTIAASTTPPTPPPTLPPSDAIWHPTPGAPIHWQWQLSKPLNTATDLIPDVTVYDIDAFDNTASTVTNLKAKGCITIAYMSCGTYENWREDANKFPAEVLGNDVSGWQGEKWLDIRRLDIIGPIMQQRMDMAKAKGFDAIEPDNIDAYTNSSGFPLTYNDQITYNKWLADEAHKRGLSIGLKNDVDQIPDLVSYFDWTLNEEAFRYSEYSTLTPFIKANKAVFNVEYRSSDAKPTIANSMKINSMVRDLNLKAPISTGYVRTPCISDSVNVWP